MGKIRSPWKQKLLLALASGVVLSFSRSPKTHQYVYKNLPKAWEKINRVYLRHLVREFYHDRLISLRENSDGMTTIILSEKGRRRALSFSVNGIRIIPTKHWDKKWRLVFFDVPEKSRPIRDLFRAKLKQIGFLELQKSVFICPYPCEKEIIFLIEYYDARQYVKYGEITHLTNEAELRLKFDV